MSYTIVDNCIFDIDISPSSKLIYVALCKYANKNGVCYPSIETLSKVTNIKSRTTIIKCIHELSQHGLIEVIRGKHNSNTYIIKSQHYIDNAYQSCSKIEQDKYSVQEINQSKNESCSKNELLNNTTIWSCSNFEQNTILEFNCNNVSILSNNSNQIRDNIDIQTIDKTIKESCSKIEPNNCSVQNLDISCSKIEHELYLYNNNIYESNNNSYSLEDQLSLDKLLDIAIEENKKKKNNIEIENKSLLKILELQERKIKQNRERIYKEILENK